MSDQKPSYVSRGGIIFLAILMLLTIAIPLGIRADGNKAVWHWDVMQKAFQSDWSDLPKAVQMHVIFYITAWGVAVLSLVLAAALRNLPLAVLFLIVLIAGIVVIAVKTDGAFSGVSDPLGGSSFTRTFIDTRPIKQIKDLDAETQQTITGLVILAFLVVTGIRSRIGPSVLMSVLQVVTAAAFAGWIGLIVWNDVELLRKIPKRAPAIVWGTTIYPVAMLGLMALGGVIAFFHGLALQTRNGQVTRGARASVLLAIWGLVGFLPTVLAIAAQSIVPVLYLLGPLLIIMCYLMLALEAVTGLLASLCGIACPADVPEVQPVGCAPVASAASPAAGAGADVTERLQRLDHLRAQGAISAEEYALQRQRILSQL